MLGGPGSPAPSWAPGHSTLALGPLPPPPANLPGLRASPGPLPVGIEPGLLPPALARLRARSAAASPSRQTGTAALAAAAAGAALSPTRYPPPPSDEDGRVAGLESSAPSPPHPLTALPPHPLTADHGAPLFGSPGSSVTVGLGGGSEGGFGAQRAKAALDFSDLDPSGGGQGSAVVIRELLSTIQQALSKGGGGGRGGRGCEGGEGDSLSLQAGVAPVPGGGAGGAVVGKPGSRQRGGAIYVGGNAARRRSARARHAEEEEDEVGREASADRNAVRVSASSPLPAPCLINAAAL
jgi:hypothetical protein